VTPNCQAMSPVTVGRVARVKVGAFHIYTATSWDRRRRGQRRVVAIPIASRWQSWTPSSRLVPTTIGSWLPLLKRCRDHRMGTGAVATRDGARELVAAIWLRVRRKADPLVAHWGTGALSIMSNPTPASAEGASAPP